MYIYLKYIITNDDSMAERKLFPYQVPHVNHLVAVLAAHRRGLDGSDTGSGKTDTTCAVAKTIGAPMFVICTKSVVVNWFETARAYGAEIIGVSNYECIRGGKYYTSADDAIAERKSVAKFLRARKVERDSVFEWSLPDNVLVVIDEAHRGKNNATLTSSFIMSLAATPYRILLLSATISDKTDCFRTAACVLGLAQHEKYAYNVWLKTLRGTDTASTMAKIHSAIFPNYGSRMRIADINAAAAAGAADGADAAAAPHFGNLDVVAEVYDVSPEAEHIIEEAYAEIREASEALKEKHALASTALASMTYAHMRIELTKVPVAVDVIREFLEAGYSVPVFVNFNHTVDQIVSMINGYVTEKGIKIAFIRGGQTQSERFDNIAAFNNNSARIIISNAVAGGVGISLHDLHGVRRASVIMPPRSGIALKQILGRTHRANSVTSPIARIVYARGRLCGADGSSQRDGANTEMRIAQLLNEKLANIQQLNDGFTDERIFQAAP